MRIGFVGCGAIGSCYASYLSRKHEVCVLDTYAPVIESIKKNGILLDECAPGSGTGETVSFRPAMATTDPKEIGVVDLLIVFVHYQYLEAAVRNALPMIDRHTMILCLQNGLGNYDEIAKVVPEEQIIIGAGTELLYTLIIQLLGREKRYAVEDPGYGKIARIYQAHQVPLCRVGLDSGGLDVAQLRRQPADVVHISPSHHYPTGIVMPIITLSIFTNLASATPEMVGSMVVPLLVCVVIGTIAFSLASILVGKLFGYSWQMSMAIGSSCLFGFPGTVIISNEVSESTGAHAEERAAINAQIMPKMLVAGMVTVSITSVLVAGVMSSWL